MEAYQSEWLSGLDLKGRQVTVIVDAVTTEQVHCVVRVAGRGQLPKPAASNGAAWLASGGSVLAYGVCELAGCPLGVAR